VTAEERLRERRERHRRRPLVVRALVALGGFATLAAGLALLVLPGPGIPLVASTGRQRLVAGAALLGSAGAGAAGIALWGLPGL
jgi:hypothetical protein